MQQRYEYKFVRLGEGWLSARREAKQGYQKEIEEHAKQGWRLVQIFGNRRVRPTPPSPGSCSAGSAIEAAVCYFASAK